MRIVGGKNRGRVLESPQGDGTRPTSDRARESVFNILHHAKWLPFSLPEEALVMDVFAGTGALGLEALSLGAAQAIFIELDRAAAALCRRNIAQLGLEARSVVKVCDALALPKRPQDAAPRTLVFLDQPYGKGLGAKALLALADKDWLAAEAVCVMEMSKKQQEDAPPGFVLQDERRYGVALMQFFTRAPAP